MAKLYVHIPSTCVDACSQAARTLHSTRYVKLAMQAKLNVFSVILYSRFRELPEDTREITCILKLHQ